MWGSSAVKRLDGLAQAGLPTFGDRDRGLQFTGAVAVAIRYRQFLEIIVARYQAADEAYRALSKAFRDGTLSMTSDTIPKGPVQQLVEAENLLHIEIEAFYVFGKILLDKVAGIIRAALEHADQRSARLTRHRQNLRIIRRLRCDEKSSC